MNKPGKSKKPKGKEDIRVSKPKKIIREEIGKEIRGIVRLANNDLDGHLKLQQSLIPIKGIGHSLRIPVANIISKNLNIDKNIRIGELSEDQINDVNNIIYSLDSKILPSFLLNRRSDQASGLDIHVVMNDLLFVLRQDVEAKKKMRSYQGFRHIRGKKVRGQRTRNTGRRGASMGVVKKKVMPGQVAPAAPGASAPAASEKEKPK